MNGVFQRFDREAQGRKLLAVLRRRQLEQAKQGAHAESARYAALARRVRRFLDGRRVMACVA